MRNWPENLQYRFQLPPKSNEVILNHVQIHGKVLARILLARIEPRLTENLRSQQSGFTSGCSIVDAILALRLLLDNHKEFQQPLHVAYVDLKSAFDSVDRAALWKALRGIGILTALLNLIKGFY